MHVELPDGSKKEVADNATVADVAASIGKRLARVGHRLMGMSLLQTGDIAQGTACCALRPRFP